MKPTLTSLLKGVRRYYLAPSVRPIIQIGLFAAITLAFHYSYWDLGLRRWLVTFAWFNDFRQFMVWAVFTVSAWINEYILGLDIVRQGFTIILPKHGYVEVVEDCSGTKQFLQILVLFILFPGPWKHKLWYIPTAIVVMYFTNVFRIVFLTLTLIWFPQEWDFVHLWVMRPFFYVVIFIMWVIWVEKFENPRLSLNGDEGFGNN